VDSQLLVRERVSWRRSGVFGRRADVAAINLEGFTGMGVIREERQRAPASLNRREFLRDGIAGVGALGLGAHALPALRGLAAAPDRAIILLLLVGGPSQLETWDPKPDAPADVRGPFGSIATRCPGVRISEHLPRMAARMDRIALIRSMSHDTAPIHETGYQLLQTGRLSRAGEPNPHVGSVVARIMGPGETVPRFAIVPGPIASTGVDISRGQSGGWLGSAYDPLPVSSDRSAVESVFPSMKDDGNSPDYGDTTFGQICQQARRLIEAGVRVVTVNMYETVFNRVSWDCHGAAPLDDYAREILPTFDQAFTALIDDLEDRGRLETTLVVAAGEFGRTPRLNGSGGRDHWPGVWSVVLAGGGVHGGQVVGASDAHAGSPADRPVSPQDLLATMYQSLGIDASRLIERPEVGPYRLVEGGSVIRELLG
jgi:hypothetical protein